MPCTDCGGKGYKDKVVMVIEPDGKQYTYMDQEPCGSCAGTGKR